jgi:alkanesulfonate monooxygenase SsuD/methylene tetrahydromethanopterin reductase-like flavin-dependent oxidoreductase (luciferase family)
VADVGAEVPPQVLAQVDQALSVSATGSPETVRRQLAAILDTYQPDELMVTGMIHDPAARLRSFEIAAEVLTGLRSAQAAA